MDHYLFRFVCDEIRLVFQAENGEVQIKAWQATFSRLMGAMLRQGMPMEKLGLHTFQEMNQQAKHAEEALLAVMNACARCTKTLSEIQWPDGDPAAFGTWLARIQGLKASGSDFKFVLACLGWLNLSNCNLRYMDLAEAHMEGSSLVRANLSQVILGGAYLERANLSQAHLFKCDLNGASLQEANLDQANLCQANLYGVIFENASLDHTNLSQANLEYAELNGAVLYGASLKEANLRKANLEQVSWDHHTKFNLVEGWETIQNLPEPLIKKTI